MVSFSSFVLKIDTLLYAIVCTWRVFVKNEINSC